MSNTPLNYHTDFSIRSSTPHPTLRRSKNIRFGKTEEAYDAFGSLLREVIRDWRCRRILDVGGGAQPQLSCFEIEEGGLDYTVADISGEELSAADHNYKKLVLDMSGSISCVEGGYDLVFSRFVLEHVADVERLHRNVRMLLRPGGLAVHFFPTLYAFPFLINWLLPEWMSKYLLSGERRLKEKFAAHYNWCIGPTRHAVCRLEDVGFEAIEYAGFFGHGYYDNIPWLRYCHSKVRGVLLRFPAVFLTSFAWVVLRKPLEIRGWSVSD